MLDLETQVFLVLSEGKAVLSSPGGQVDVGRPGKFRGLKFYAAKAKTRGLECHPVGDQVRPLAFQ